MSVIYWLPHGRPNLAAVEFGEILVILASFRHRKSPGCTRIVQVPVYELNYVRTTFWATFRGHPPLSGVARAQFRAVASRSPIFGCLLFSVGRGEGYKWLVGLQEIPGRLIGTFWLLGHPPADFS